MDRIAWEKAVIAKMIRLYCRRREGNATLCPECRQLLEYANARLDRCPQARQKPSCRNCAVHCYHPEMRERIRRVMRWAGPRMIVYHPVDALRHMLLKR